MYVERILCPVTALGPGKRLVIWVSGCTRHCEGCANPELWERHPYQWVEVDKLICMISAQIDMSEVDGITISGGEPFDQAEELIILLNRIKQNKNVLIFSGYKIEEIEKIPEMKKLLEFTDVLVDGEYIDKKNDGRAVLRGSINQRIHILNEKCRESYDRYLEFGRQIQNFTYDYETISVGIHNNDRE